MRFVPTSAARSGIGGYGGLQRHREQSRSGLQQRAEGSAEDGKTLATMTPPCGVACTAVWSLAGPHLSFSSFGNDANSREEGKRFLSTTYNPRPQARGVSYGIGPVVVELPVAVAHGWGS
ncbi:hypothetical protein PIB30_037120 [Stylosanthes scabra]|uniref:Uncharacterized protein n=1 Tax=Stylosanthes scabra TaxID=79078 RepID=A0ABU6ZB96_9FABA|nr:hypothetical protein [Stylosanthes scabra]